jgi:dihydrofolate reductase
MLIWAMDRNGLIGREGRLPWHLPAELAYFRRTTMGHPVIMGRKTFESLGKPLPGRRNVVLSRNPDFRPEGAEVAHDVPDVLERFRGVPFFVIGGAQIYRAFLPLADKLYVTRIDHAFEGDEHFPEVDWHAWRLVSDEPGPSDERNAYPFRFQVYERRA